MTQLEIQEALWWLDEALILLSLGVWAYGFVIKARGATSDEYSHNYMFAGLIGVWAIYSLLWSV